MKHIFTKFAVLFVVFFLTTEHIKAFSLCLKDNYSGIWQLEVKRVGHLYIAKGTAAFLDGRTWPAWGFYNIETRKMELHCINPIPNLNCSPYLDSFVNFAHGRGYDSLNVPFFEAKGYQENYCNGLNVGGPTDWAIGDCNHHFSKTLYVPSGGFLNGVRINQNHPVTLKITPNPVVSYAVVQYTLPQQEKINIVVYNYLNQAVAILVNETKAAGTYSAIWDKKNSNGTAASPGLYTVVAIVDGKTYSSKMQVVK